MIARLLQLLAIAAMLAVVPPALADAAPPACQSPSHQCVSGNGTDTLGVGAVASQPIRPPGTTVQPIKSAPHDYVTYAFAPTCTGNTAYAAANICGAAVNTCPPAGQGIIRYWRWQITHHVADGTQTVIQDVQTLCLAPTTPGLPPVAAVIGLVERDFKTLVVAKGVIVIKPNGTTLVNYPTKFSTDASTYTLAPVDILGHTVVITATPQQYDWDFGDGEHTMNGGQQDVTHIYANTGTVTAHVTITWTGTFTIDGGATRDVLGTATTTGPGTPLQVKQARAELITG